MGKLKQILIGLGISSLILGVTYLPRGLEELRDETRFSTSYTGKLMIRKVDTIGYKPIYSKLITLNVFETENKDMMIWEHDKSFLHIFKNTKNEISMIFLNQEVYCNSCEYKISPKMNSKANELWEEYWDELNGNALAKELKNKLTKNALERLTRD